MFLANIVVVVWLFPLELHSQLPCSIFSFFQQTSLNSGEMAPRGRRTKAGWTRMDAALQNMRPMGFSDKAVRRSVKKLLEVYGEDGWVVIEEAAYTLLIDTMLEEVEEGDQEHEGGLLELEGGSEGSHEQPASGSELRDKKATYDEHEEPSQALEVHGSGIYCQDVQLGGVMVKGQDSDSYSDSEAVKDHKEMGVEVGFAPAPNLQTLDIVPKDDKCRPCFGWISEDEEDEVVEVTQSGSQTTHLAA